MGSEILGVTYIYADFVDGYHIRFVFNEFELIPEVSISGGGASSSRQLNEFISVEQNDVVLSQTEIINHLVDANKIYSVGAIYEDTFHPDADEPRMTWKIIITYK